MEVVIDDKERRVEIWLNRAEKEDEVLRKWLKGFCAKYKDMKYMVAIFNSGEQDLFVNIRDLLLHNQRLAGEDVAGS